MWEVKVTHEGLHAYRNVRGATKEEAETKARLQVDAWNARFQRLREVSAARQERLIKQNHWDTQTEFDKRAKHHALALTKDAELELAGLRGLLTGALIQAHPFNWEELKDTSRFEKPEPVAPAAEQMPSAPLQSEPQFTVLPAFVRLTFTEWIIPGARKKKLLAARDAEALRKKEAQQRFDAAHSDWEKK